MKNKGGANMALINCPECNREISDTVKKYNGSVVKTKI